MVHTPGDVQFPVELDSVDSLIQATNNAASTIDTAFTSVATVLVLTSGDEFPSSGTITLATGEILYYTERTGKTFSGLVRSQEGTTADATVPVGTSAELRGTARHHTVLVDGLIATQTKLGTGASTPTAGTFLKGTGTGTTAYAALTGSEVTSVLGYTPQDAALGATDAELDAVEDALTGLIDVAQDTADTGVTNAATAQGTANTALTNAATAQNTANAASTSISNLLSGTPALGSLLVGVNSTQAAWQSTSALSFVSGQLGINRAAPGAMLHTTSGGAGVIPFVAQGGASQTGNLTEWRDSVGTVLSVIGSTGQLGLNRSAPDTLLHMRSTAAGNTPIHVDGAGSQTANLTEWRTNANAVLTAIGPDGHVGINRNTSISSMLFIIADAAATPVATFRGAVSQSGLLTTWQDSGGATLASVGSGGNFGIGVSAAAATVLNLMSRATGDTVLRARAFAGQTGDLTLWLDSAGATLSRVAADGRFGIQSAATAGWALTIGTAAGYTGGISSVAVSDLTSGNFYGINSGITLNAANAGSAYALYGRLTLGAAGSIAASYGAYIEAPTVTAGGVSTINYGVRIQSMGNAAFGTSYGLYLAAQSGATTTYAIYSAGGPSMFLAGAAATVPLTLRGAASQSADLQHWQNSSGTQLVAIGPDGVLALGGISTTTAAGYKLYALGTPAANGQSVIATQGTSSNSTGTTYGVTALALQGVTGTATLIGLYGRAGTIAGTITLSSAIALYANSPQVGAGSTITAAYGLRVEGQGAAGVGTAYGIYLSPQTGATTNYAIYSTGGQNRFMAATVSETPLVLRGFASQSANLQEWQNSSGTMLSAVDAAGRFGVLASPSASYSAVVGGASNTTQTGLLSVGTTMGAVSGNQYSLFSDPVQNVNSTGVLIGVASRVRVTAAISLANGQAFQALAPNIGGGGVLTIAAGLNVQNQGNAAVATSYGVLIAAQSGATTTWAIDSQGGTARFQTGAAATIGVIVRGAASQSANLQEWQNSSGGVLASVGSAGALTTTSTITAAPTASGAQAQLLLNSADVGGTRASRIDWQQQGVTKWTAISDYSGNATNDLRFLASVGATPVLTLAQNGNVSIGVSGASLGFFGTAPIAKPAITGSRGGNAAVAALLTALANLGLITDSTSA